MIAQHDIDAVRAAWFLNKPNPTLAEEAQYRAKGFDTLNGFYAALALLTEAVTILCSTGIVYAPPEGERAKAIIEAYLSALSPVMV